MGATPFIGEMSVALNWEETDLLFMIWAYYDESGEYDQSGNLLNMSIGGCVASLENWRGFGAEWQAILEREGLSHFHMTDFEKWSPPFDFKLPDGSRDKERHNRLLNDLLKVMLDRVDYFAGFAESKPIPADAKRAHGSSMEGCVVAAISHAVHDLWDRYQQPINLVFGKQKHFGYGKILKYQEMYDWGEGAGRIKHLSMASPLDLPQLQAADILAYEMSKEQRDRPRRYPFKTLVEGAKERGTPITINWKISRRLFS